MLFSLLSVSRTHGCPHMEDIPSLPFTRRQVTDSTNNETGAGVAGQLLGGALGEGHACRPLPSSCRMNVQVAAA